MSRRSTLSALAFCFLLVSGANAQDAMGGSAPTLGARSFELEAYPMVFVQSEAVSRMGFGFLGGYGLTDHLDLELEAVYNDDINFYYGAGAKYWLLRGDSFDVSVFGGYNRRPQTNGLEAGATVSHPLGTSLALYGGVDTFFGFAEQRDYTLFNVDLGAQYQVMGAVKLFAEASLGFGDENDRLSYFVAGAGYFFEL